MAGGLLAGYWWVDSVAPGESGRLFADNPEFRVWALLIGANVAVWPIVVAVAVGAWGELAGTFPRTWLSAHPRRRIAWIVATLVALGCGVFLLNLAAPEAEDLDFLDRWRWRTRIVAILAYVAAAPAAGIIVAVAISAQELAAGKRPTVADLRIVNHQLGRCLAALGGAISLAVLAYGTLRNAIAVTPGVEEAPPAVLVPLYGAMLTLAVAVLYVPAHAALARLGRRVIDDEGLDVDTIAAVKDDCFRGLVARRQWLESQLDMGSAETRLRSALLVLAPVLSGLGSYLVG